MSCILYRLTQLAAFFLDQRAEWSTTNSCYCLLNLSWRHHQWWCRPNCKLGKSFWFWLKLGLDNEKASFRKPFIILNALKAHTTHKWCAHFSHVKLPCIRGFGFGWQIFKPSSSLVLRTPNRHPASSAYKRQEQQTRHQYRIGKEGFHVSAITQIVVFKV